MLYRTHHHPFLCTFSPFPHSSFITSSSPSSHPLQEMECVHGALVSGLGPETPSKTAAFMDDFSEVSGLSGDELFVYELLDFSNDFSEEEREQQPQELEEPEEKEQDMGKAFPFSLEKLTAPEKSAVPVKDDFGPLPESELSVPADGLESLEWLSHFVDDSFSDYSLAGKLSSMPTANRPEQEATGTGKAYFTTPVQTKARTKRARTGVRVWPVLSPSFAESSTSSTSSTSATSFPPPNPWKVQSQAEEFINGKPPAKKQKKKPADAASASAVQPRRCSHCGVTKTPQWRAGPLGSKTLCNACGVRFKSGRLLPEYRPACSPTFSSELHSNNHRKVLEMRRNKEPEMEADPGLTPQVQSF
ncbi:hypothetical protein OROGR_017346 [Orobanche gracilis]